MNAKLKTAPKRNTRQAIRARYKWYLQPPFENTFDHSHWWKGLPDSEISSVAALYELARRDPLVGEMRTKFSHASWYGQELRAPLVGDAKERMASKAFDDLGQQPKAIHCLCLIGLKSWSKLDWRNQEYWEMSAGKMKGVDCRHDIERCNSITLMARSEIIIQRMRSLKLGKPAFQFRVGAGKNNDYVAPVHPQAHKEAIDLLSKHLIQKPIKPVEMEKAIARTAIAAHRKGDLLISVAPDLTVDEAIILLEREYRGHQKLTQSIKQRASFSKNWLDLISEFEDAEAAHEKVRSQVFVRYRRAMDGIRFTSRRH